MITSCIPRLDMFSQTWYTDVHTYTSKKTEIVYLYVQNSLCVLDTEECIQKVQMQNEEVFTGVTAEILTAEPAGFTEKTCLVVLLG